MNTEEKILDFLFYWGRPITPGQLKKELKIKLSTLNSAFKRLEEKGLIIWEKYGTVQLTEKGREQAAHLTNHHFIIEKFFTDFLDLPQELAHREALNLAPHISCVVIDAMAKKIGVHSDEMNKDFCKQRNYIYNLASKSHSYQLWEKS